MRRTRGEECLVFQTNAERAAKFAPRLGKTYGLNAQQKIGLLFSLEKASESIIANILIICKLYLYPSESGFRPDENPQGLEDLLYN